MDAAELVAAEAGHTYTPKRKFTTTVCWPWFSPTVFAVGNATEVNPSQVTSR